MVGCRVFLPLPPAVCNVFCCVVSPLGPVVLHTLVVFHKASVASSHAGSDFPQQRRQTLDPRIGCTDEKLSAGGEITRTIKAAASFSGGDPETQQPGIRGPSLPKKKRAWSLCQALTKL